MQGMVFDIQHFCLQDGPGIRTVVFLKGCPLQCAWCHNPESHKMYPQLMFSAEKCKQCGSCLAACPAAYKTPGELRECTYPEKNLCGVCAKACPSGALRMCGYMASVEDVFDEVERDHRFYLHSEGGITLSGGEPLMQPEFSLSLLKKSKAAGMNTAVETCGFFEPDLVPLFHNDTDLWLYDIKLLSEQEHLCYTGVSNKQILENLTSLDALGAKIILRLPLIPGVNDHEAHILAVGELANRLSHIAEIHMIPYHTLGESKAIQLGETVKMQCEPPAPERCEQFAQSLQSMVGCAVKVL